jgi:hypothetical protein
MKIKNKPWIITVKRPRLNCGYAAISDPNSLNPDPKSGSTGPIVSGHNPDPDRKHCCKKGLWNYMNQRRCKFYRLLCYKLTWVLKYKDRLCKNLPKVTFGRKKLLDVGVIQACKNY